MARPHGLWHRIKGCRGEVDGAAGPGLDVLKGAGPDSQARAQALIDAQTLDRHDTTRALDLEGICYEQAGEPAKAVRALENAERMLGAEDAKERAAVLDNLGRVYLNQGDLETAARLYALAFHAAEASRDHDVMVRLANNQAGIALTRHDRRKARKYLQQVDQQRRRSPGTSDDVLASIASMKGWLALEEGDIAVARDEYQAALDSGRGVTVKGIR